MRKTREQYTRANRIAWNEAAARHAAHNNAELFEACRQPDFNTLEDDILDTLLRVGVEGKDVVHLCCNNGRETLSLRNLGAARCVGIDAADEFLEHGREMVRLAGAGEQVEFIQSDVYDLPAGLEGAFDLVLVTIGVVSWMPDLKGFFRVVQSLLKPGGRLVMEDMHPILFMYEEGADGEASTIEYSYFEDHVWEETSGLDYYGGEEYESEPSYSFMHRLDQILMAGIDCDLSLEYFKELDYDISLFCADLENSPTRPPLGFVMVMRKN